MLARAAVIRRRCLGWGMVSILISVDADVPRFR
jgi:hypothetical protein